MEHRKPIRPWWLWSALALLLTGLMAVSYKVVSFSKNPLSLLPPELPEVQALKLYQEHFATQSDVMVLVEAKDSSLAELAVKSLAAEFNKQPKTLIQGVSWRPPWLVETAEGDERLNPEAGEFLAYLWMNQSSEELAKLISRLDDAPKQLEASMTSIAEGVSKEAMVLGYDPLGFTKLPGQKSFQESADSRIGFASPDGLLRVIHLEAAEDLYDYDFTIEWLRQLNEIVAAWQKSTPEAKDVTVTLAGRAAFLGEVAGNLHGEMIGNIALTALVIAGLFWFAYRRLKPLLWLLVALAITTILSLSIGGLIYRELNLMTIGFAAIMLGLVVDYGFIIYAELRQHPHAGPGVRKKFYRTIGAAALTTAFAFFGLNLSSLPGARQLGTLVAIGVVLGAVVMLTFYLGRIRYCLHSKDCLPDEPEVSGPRRTWRFLVGPRMALLITAVFVGGGIAVLVEQGMPQISTDPKHLRPKNSTAFYNHQRALQMLSGQKRSLSLIVTAKSDEEMRQKLGRAEIIIRQSMADAQDAARPLSFSLPTVLWPDRDHLNGNRNALGALANRKDALRKMFVDAGFSDEGFDLASQVMDGWRKLTTTTEIVLPSSAASSWVMDKVMVRKNGLNLATGFVRLPNNSTLAHERPLVEALQKEGIIAANWDHLNPSILRLTRQDFTQAFLPIVGILFIMLVITFRKLREVVLSLLVMLLSSLVLAACMKLSGMDWNLVNIAAIPLLVGCGLDYSIHIQLAIRRYGWNPMQAQRLMVRAIVLCAGTTAAGFGSLMTSSSAALDSLGRVCGMGIVITTFISLILLPVWWKFLHRTVEEPSDAEALEKPILDANPSA